MEREGEIIFCLTHSLPSIAKVRLGLSQMPGTPSGSLTSVATIQVPETSPAASQDLR